MLFAATAGVPQFAAAADVFATVRLRGGFDSNPTLVSPARGSGFFGTDAEIAAQEESDTLDAKLEAATRVTDFVELPIEPTQHSNVLLEASNKDRNNISLKSFSRIEHDRSYDERALSATQRLRAQWVGSWVRPYLTGEARYATLNETHDFRPDFLPEPLRHVRTTAVPGVALNFDQLEIGGSVNVSALHYETSAFGPLRDSNRMQPYLFLSYVSDDVDIFTSLSQLFASWRDPAFTDLQQTMFETRVKVKTKPLRAELEAKREAAETTFEFAPVTVATLLSARLVYDLNDRTTLGASARRLTIDYVQTPFTSHSVSYGIGAGYDLGNAFSVGADLTRVVSTSIFGEKTYATIAMLSLTQQFGGEAEKRAASLPPGALIESPAMRPPSGWSN